MCDIHDITGSIFHPLNMDHTNPNRNWKILHIETH